MKNIGLGAWIALAAASCASPVPAEPTQEVPSIDEEGRPEPSGPLDVERVPDAPAELPAARRLRRLSAEQLDRSLRVATGQRWRDFERRAAALGRPDYDEVLSENREISVAFDKLVGDAAAETCSDAVAADRAGAAAPAILRHASVADVAEPVLRRNVSYLLLRFHGVVVPPDDPRVEPWLHLLTAPVALDASTGEDAMALRWTAVCIGLATHPDFLTY